MYITDIKINGFRNLKGIALSPSPNINVLMGENAQGKTNLLEALWIASGAKSFRNAKERDMLGFTSQIATVDVSFKDNERSQTVSITLGQSTKERKILLNGVKLRSFSELIGKLQCVVFTPEDLDLTKGSPEVRRNYIDLCISQIKPMYAKVISKYENILWQRNALLKNIVMGISKPEELDIWDDQLSRQGAYISMLRKVYTDILYRQSAKLYHEISGGSEALSLEYYSTVFENLENRTDYKGEMANEYFKKLKSCQADDIRLGYTQVGVHRDDILVKINGISVKDFGSQGQNRSAALCMKLGQAHALCEEIGEMPVILLDDVLSELDKHRKNFVLKQINDAQIFITCCEPIKIKAGVFTVNSGEIK